MPGGEDDLEKLGANSKSDPTGSESTATTTATTTTVTNVPAQNTRAKTSGSTGDAAVTEQGRETKLRKTSVQQTSFETAKQQLITGAMGVKSKLPREKYPSGSEDNPARRGRPRTRDLSKNARQDSRNRRRQSPNYDDTKSKDEYLRDKYRISPDKDKLSYEQFLAKLITDKTALAAIGRHCTIQGPSMQMPSSQNNPFSNQPVTFASGALPLNLFASGQPGQTNVTQYNTVPQPTAFMQQAPTVTRPVLQRVQPPVTQQVFTTQPLVKQHILTDQANTVTTATSHQVPTSMSAWRFGNQPRPPVAPASLDTSILNPNYNFSTPAAQLMPANASTPVDGMNSYLGKGGRKDPADYRSSKLRVQDVNVEKGKKKGKKPSKDFLYNYGNDSDDPDASQDLTVDESRRRKVNIRMRVPTFAGEDFHIFRPMFNAAAARANWDDLEKSEQLQNALRGTAKRILGYVQPDKWSYDTIMAELEKQYGETKSFADISEKLLTMKRKTTQSLHDFAFAILKKSRAGKMPDDERERLVRQAFVLGLGDPGIRGYVERKDDGKRSLQVAVDLATKYERDHCVQPTSRLAANIQARDPEDSDEEVEINKFESYSKGKSGPPRPSSNDPMTSLKEEVERLKEKIAKLESTDVKPNRNYNDSRQRRDPPQYHDQKRNSWPERKNYGNQRGGGRGRGYDRNKPSNYESTKHHRQYYNRHLSAAKAAQAQSEQAAPPVEGQSIQQPTIQQVTYQIFPPFEDDSEHTSEYEGDQE